MRDLDACRCREWGEGWGEVISGEYDVSYVISPARLNKQVCTPKMCI